MAISIPDGYKETHTPNTELVNLLTVFGLPTQTSYFSYQLQTISIMLLQFMQQPYDSTLSTMFNIFLANLVDLPHDGLVLHSNRHLE
jgi:hypothetical protein